MKDVYDRMMERMGDLLQEERVSVPSRIEADIRKQNISSENELIDLLDKYETSSPVLANYLDAHWDRFLKLATTKEEGINEYSFDDFKDFDEFDDEGNFKGSDEDEELKARVYGDIEDEGIKDTEDFEDLYQYYKEEFPEAADYVDAHYEDIIEYIFNRDKDNSLDSDDIESIKGDEETPEIAWQILDDFNEYVENMDIDDDDVEKYFEDLISYYDDDSEKKEWLSDPDNLAFMVNLYKTEGSNPEGDYYGRGKI